jgi:DNA polymerase-4
VWSEPILHVDMDAFFVEVERLGDPGLIGKPVAVGGTGPRGVIASASYEARKFGVRSAQPTGTALRSCPHLIVVSPSHGRYGEVSERVFAVFRSFTPMVEGLSVDEAFLDVSGLSRHFSHPVEVGDEIRSVIASEIGLPASVGVAATKFVAKLASESAKPNGIRHVAHEDQIAFLQALPVDALWGVGPATLAALARLGVETVGDLAGLPEATVATSLGQASARHLLDLANGRDPRPVIPDSEAKSISVEETFARDLVGADRVEAALLSQSQRLAGRLRRAGLAAKTIVVKVRYEDFTTVTRSHTGDRPIDAARDIFDAGKRLVAETDRSRPVRLLGMGGQGLVDAGRPRQLTIDDNDRWDRLADAVSDIAQRFGDTSIGPARLADTRGREEGIDR